MSIRRRDPLRFGAIAHASAGPMVFWAEVGKLYHGKGQRKYLSWEEWDRFFELAQEHGMIDVYEDSGRFVHEMGLCVYRAWRAVREAKAAGLSPWQFHQREMFSDARERQERKEQDARDRAAAIERKKRAITKFREDPSGLAL